MTSPSRQTGLSALQAHFAGLGVTPVTRFAPSPTGFLHLGHIAAALAVWGIGRILGAKVLLRIEDHDRIRTRLEYEDAAIADLSWFGFVPDNCLTDNCVQDNGAAGSQKLLPEFYQRNRLERYATLAKQLGQQGDTYFCNCTRRQIKARTAEQSQDELYYDGHCRTLSEGKPDSGIRIRVPHETIPFFDYCLGAGGQNPATQCGDFLIKDRKGNWTYQFAVACDDHDQGVNLIIRGEDLYPSTGRQILLQQKLFGHSPPIAYWHHGLIRDETGGKLSKRFLSEGARNLGTTPGPILKEAAKVLGVDSAEEWDLGSWPKVLQEALTSG